MDADNIHPAAVIGIVLAFPIAFFAYLNREYIPWPTGNSIDPQGESICREEDGLPGGATGKYFHIVGSDEEPWVIDGYAYGPGEYVFIDYCGPDGDLIR